MYLSLLHCINHASCFALVFLFFCCFHFMGIKIKFLLGLLLFIRGLRFSLLCSLCGRQLQAVNLPSLMELIKRSKLDLSEGLALEGSERNAGSNNIWLLA